MKLILSIALPIFSLIILSSSCKKHVIQPADQLSLLPAATQTGANTFGCLVNGQAFVPKNRSFLVGPIMQCNYIYTSGGYYFEVSGGNNNSSGYPVAIFVQTDSLTVSEGQTLSLTQYATAGMASGSYGIGTSAGILNYYTNQNQSGQLNITHMDTVKQIISGTFYFNATSSSGDVVKVTNGRFDMPYTR